MPYYRLFYHLIWSTKNRLPLIDQEIEKGLYPYLQQKAREIDCHILAGNGMGDHIHLVIEIPPQRSVSDVVKHLKGASSHEFGDLYWQRGYGALTVGERHLEAALSYVNHQKEHHAKRTIYSKLERSDEDPNEGPPAIREEPGDYQVGEADPFEFC